MECQRAKMNVISRWHSLQHECQRVPTSANECQRPTKPMQIAASARVPTSANECQRVPTADKTNADCGFSTSADERQRVPTIFNGRPNKSRLRLQPQLVFVWLVALFGSSPIWIVSRSPLDFSCDPPCASQSQSILWVCPCCVCCVCCVRVFCHFCFVAVAAGSQAGNHSANFETRTDLYSTRRKVWQNDSPPPPSSCPCPH